MGSILFPFALGTACSVWWYDVNDEDPEDDWETPSFTAFVLFAGTSLSFTAFPVLCSILKSTHQSTTDLDQMVLHESRLAMPELV